MIIIKLVVILACSISSYPVDTEFAATSKNSNATNHKSTVYSTVKKSVTIVTTTEDSDIEESWEYEDTIIRELDNPVHTNEWMDSMKPSKSAGFVYRPPKLLMYLSAVTVFTLGFTVGLVWSVFYLHNRGLIELKL